MARAVVRPEPVRAERARRNVDRSVTRRIEQPAVADNIDGLSLVGRAGRPVAQAWRWTGIDGRARCAAGRNGERRDVAPLRADGLLNAVGHGNAVLADHVLELKWLPAIRIDQSDPGLRDD